MSTHKTTVSQDIVLDFLKSEMRDAISDFEVIDGGEGSQAYAFAIAGEQYVIRVNKHSSQGFKKDAYTYEHFRSADIPIPKIVKIGMMPGNLHYCISQKVEGDTLDSFRGTDTKKVIEDLFKVFDAIHAVDISGTKGFGKWNAEGTGRSASWKECMLGVDEWVKGTEGKPSLFETTFLEKEFWDRAYARLAELVEFCPEERRLVHGDYGFNNVLSDGKKITGVIDWESSLYGDFIFDLAWLCFWSQKEDYEKLYLDHNKKQGIEIKNFKERLQCYQVCIGLQSISFFAYSGQKEKYEMTKKTIGKLL